MNTAERRTLGRIAKELFPETFLDGEPEPEPEHFEPLVVEYNDEGVADGVAVSLHSPPPGANYIPRGPILVTGWGECPYDTYVALDFRGSAPTLVAQLRALEEAPCP